MNQHVYKDMLQKKVLPWSRKHFCNKNWVFQQDSAPAHKATMVQTWISENFPDFINSKEWHPSSPDLNPMDYCFWGILEKNACNQPCSSVAVLKKKLKREWDKIELDVVEKCYNGWLKRLDNCIKAKGGNFE